MYKSGNGSLTDVADIFFLLLYSNNNDSDLSSLSL